MSTAGRATYNPAIAKSHKQGGPISQQYSSKDILGQTKIKYRQPGQGTKEELQEKNLRRTLEEKEYKSITREEDEDESSSDEEEAERSKSEVDAKSTEEVGSKNLDADDSDDSDSEESSNEKESEDEDDDEDDTAELMRELEKIKREREQEAARREMENLADQKAQSEEQLMSSNPLLKKDEEEDFNIKKRWYDDSVFKNQTKGEQKVQKRFINDTIRNDFHRKFMSKYVQ
eukprot:TRINITY_DN2220_c0_g1_i1.p1 TRINITY_DN2220_c0_g1~~TRINITY_DN2220_c0_g1_i1.p1  ORF type:complete len:231 (-),score=107.87 TRINITY_DN2220_c0_g1_i1:153-845(-)